MRKQTSIYLTEEVRDRLMLAQDRYGITMNGVIQASIMQYLRREEL